MSPFNSFCFTLATFLASSVLQVGAVPVPKGRANFQYAVAFHNETECQACLMENITAYEGSCMEMLTQFMNGDFLRVNVEILHKIAACTEKPNLMLLSVKLIHRTHPGTVAPTKENNQTLSITRVLECSCHLPPGETFQLCFDPILKAVSLNATIPTSPAADTSKTLLDYIPTALLVLLIAVLLASGLLGVLVKKRQALGGALDKAIRTMVWGRELEPERQPLLGDRLPHTIQQDDGEDINDSNGPSDGEDINNGNDPVDGEDINNGNDPVDGEDINDGNGPVDIAMWAQRVLEQPFVGPRWGDPVARLPVQHQNSASGSTVSAPSQLFDALMIETPPFRKSLSPEGSGYCSLDYQRH